MNLDQQRRYARQIMLAEVGELGQQKLLDAKVLVIGAGGLGSAMISYLAAAGVGTIGIIDNDRVELSNLARQILHETGDIGRLKVESAADRVAEINPDVKMVTYPFAITAANAVAVIGGGGGDAGKPSPSGRGLGEGFGATAVPHEAPLLTSPRRGEERAASRLGVAPSNNHALHGYDIVADGCDNFMSRFAVNAACVTLKKPLVSAAIAGWQGQLMTIAPHLLAGSACYQCLVHPDAPEINTCRESGIIGPLAGIIGSMQALEVVNLILGRPALIGKLARYDAKTMTQRVSDVVRDTVCTICG